jgi:hypothetical protein
VGRQAAAATDANLGAEIYSYCRSRGLFAGVSLDGSALQIQQAQTQAYYSSPSGGTQVPASAAQLVGLVARYTTAPDAANAVQPAAIAGENQPATATTGNAPAPTTVPSFNSAGMAASGSPNQAATTSEAAVRQQLVQAAQSLQPLVDDNWKQYLALPASLNEATGQPNAQALQETVKRYESVANNPQYATLAKRTEFQTTYQLLRAYLGIVTAGNAGALNLPPPPGQLQASPGAQPIGN